MYISSLEEKSGLEIKDQYIEKSYVKIRLWIDLQGDCVNYKERRRGREEGRKERKENEIRTVHGRFNGQMSGKTGSSFQKTMRYMMPRNQKGWRWEVFNNMRVVCAMKSRRTQKIKH